MGPFQASGTKADGRLAAQVIGDGVDQSTKKQGRFVVGTRPFMANPEEVLVELNTSRARAINREIVSDGADNAAMSQALPASDPIV